MSAPVPVAATTTPETPAEAPTAEQPAPVETPPAADDQGDGTKAEGEAPATGDDDKPLAAAGEKALGIWKDRAKNAEQDLKAAQRERDEAVAKLADAGLASDEQILAAARREAATEATATVTTTASKAVAMQALLAEAKGRLADPSDAAAFLDVSDFKIGADFTVDPAEIAEAVTSLLARKPHLAVKTDGAATAPPAVVPPAGIGQGVREKDTPSFDAQIAEALKAGDINRSIALKRAKALLAQ